MPARNWLCLLALATLSLSCHALLIRHDRDIQRYRELGSRVEFASVGRNENGSEISASGVLVAPRWVLTAAHVAEIGPAAHGWWFGDERFSAVRTVFHPRYQEATNRQRLQNGWDLALVELDRPVQAVRPANRTTARNEVGMAAILIAFGMVGDGSKGPFQPIRQERLGGENMLDAAGAKIGPLVLGDAVLISDFDGAQQNRAGEYGSSFPLELEAGFAWGDSGGGVFVRSGDGFRLIGIATGVIPADGRRDPSAPWGWRYGQIIATTRVEPSNAWIDEVIRAAAP